MKIKNIAFVGVEILNTLAVKSIKLGNKLKITIIKHHSIQTIAYRIFILVFFATTTTNINVVNDPIINDVCKLSNIIFPPYFINAILRITFIMNLIDLIGLAK